MSAFLKRFNVARSEFCQSSPCTLPGRMDAGSNQGDRGPLGTPSVPLNRQESRQHLILRLKRRVYSTGLLLIILSGISSTVMAVLGTASYPSLTMYFVTNGLMILVSVAALLALRHLKYLRIVEVSLTVITVGFLLYWDMVPLWTHYFPKAEYLMTSNAHFLLAAALVCLIVPQKQLFMALAALFVTHETLVWANLLQFPWGNTQNAQLLTDLLTLITILCLSLIGTYQHLIGQATVERETLQRLASTDPLTGLPNRRSLYQQLHAGAPAALLLMDIDDFKLVNDRLGHDAGDEVLVEVGQALQAAVVGRGTVARWGGEEFMALLPGMGVQEALNVAESIRWHVAQVDVPGGPVTLSIGLAVRREDEHLEQTLKRADERLYAAKNQGKNRVCSETELALNLAPVPEP